MEQSMADNSDSGNVLFEPAIYRPDPVVADNMDMEDDHISVSTHGGHTSIISNYKTDLDPALFAANKM